MRKKRSKVQADARRTYYKVGISIVLVIALIAFLFYLAPREGTVGRAAEIRVGPTEPGAVPVPDTDSGDCTSPLVSVRTPFSFDTATIYTICCSEGSFCAWRGTSGGCYALESIHESPRSGNYYYCAINFQEYVPSAEPGHGWVRCDSSTRNAVTEDNRFICDGASWVQCNEDTGPRVTYDDRTIACNVDTGRWEESKGVSCGGSNVWVWSYLPGEETSEPPSRIGCCESNQCWSSVSPGSCVDYDTPASSVNTICGNSDSDGNNNWDKCGAVTNDGANKHPGDVSDGGGYTCIQNATGSYLWRQVCNAENQFREDNNEVCYNNQWRSCQNIPPVTEVDISCTGAGDMSVEERSCNDGIDNDLDESFDCADAGCNSNIPIAVSPDDEYQVTVRSDACTGQSYNIN